MAAENKYNKQKLDTRNKKYKRSVAGKIQPAKCIIIISSFNKHKAAQ